ncbi:hypothetical protein M9Y10_012365 [Tritrichomonas musculus]|uniref:ABC transporter domain-containing protein n=1 Tax=Tritrichomonas musculus TaxID=1915356 RepID=A0ABR2GMD1_9EUKA
MFHTSHYKAILFRRWITMKRSWKATVTSLVGTLVASALAIVLNYCFIVFLRPKAKVMSFKDFDSNTRDLIFLDNSNTFPDSQKINNYLVDIFHKETGRKINSLTFSSVNEMKAWVIEHERSYAEPESIPLAVGYSIESTEAGSHYTTTTFFNVSDFSQISDELDVELHTSRALFKYIYEETNPDADISLSFTILNSRRIEFITAMVAPVIIGCGLLSIVPMIVTQPVSDINGEARSYMESCSLTIFPYWLATFTIDFAIWVVLTTVMWCIYLAAQIQAFLDNIFISWYLIVAAGPSFIIFMYCVSFLFDSYESASRQIFLIFAVSMLVPFIIEMIRNESNPIWLEWIFSFIPHLAIQRLYSIVLQNMGARTKSFSWYWTEKNNNGQPFFIMEIVNILIYSIILTLIERFRGNVHNRNAKRSFESYREFFKETKAKNDVTKEVLQMEEDVKNNTDYAVRILNVSRLFFNTEGQPIPSVNGVTLGVKKGSLFGFLGANGAGKTTLIRMITSLLPPSDGTIEIFGQDIQEYHDPNIISVCPQFNNHLINEMTTDEHFLLFGMIFKMDKQEIKEKSDFLVKALDLEEMRDKPLNQLSQGNVRKLAIALSFYGPAQIILLDEPTASLDPVACHDVQEMILENRGDKTFMLCTHLLSEAEFLCDMISIMVKGCVFTCGSPQALTEKFGTDYKVDVMLSDDTDETASICEDFFHKMLPKAVCSITRPKARIYDIPSSSIDLADLFQIMEDGNDGSNGYTYYTCSSSSLERVFMEIVRMSEEGG